MKLTNAVLKKVILEVLKEEEPNKKPSPPQPPADDSGGDTSKELKIDIPDSPFNPDTQQITDHLIKILRQWEVKEYKSDEHRWKCYYRDLAKFVNKIKGETSDEI